MALWDIVILICRIFICAIIFAIGSSVFSFLNVLIYRLPRHISFSGKERSRCTSCGHELASKDLIPVYSWISLKGRCRYCGERISARYTVVELIGGIVALVQVLLYGVRGAWLLPFAISLLLHAAAVTAIFIISDRYKWRRGLTAIIASAAFIIIQICTMLLFRGFIHFGIT